MTVEIRQNIEAMESDEILERIKKQFFTLESKQIAIEILGDRNIDTSGLNSSDANHREKLKKEINELVDDEVLKKFWKTSFIAPLNVLMLAAVLNTLIMAFISLVLQVNINLIIMFSTLIVWLYPSKKIIDSTLQNKPLAKIKQATWISFIILFIIKSATFTILKS